MLRAALALFAPLLACSCAMIGVGPTVDHDFCARGHIDEEFVVRDLRARAPKQPGFSDLVFTAPRTDAPASPTGRPEPHTTTRIQEIEAKIDLTAPVALFPTGPSRVVALSLPEGSHPPRSLLIAPQHSGLTVVGKLDCTKSPSGAGVFRLVDPLVTFLDASRQPVAGGSDGETATLGVQGAKRFPIPAGTKYIVVHYDSSKLGERFTLLGKDYTVLLPASGIFVPTPASGTVRGVRTSTGAFTVAFER
jgi:hypothetical protein